MRLKGRRRVVRAASVPAKATPAPPAPTQDLDAAWNEATALFANRRGMRLSRVAFAGLPERLLPDRYSKLIGTSGAKRVRHLLSLLSDGDLRVFHARAAINTEQATAAMRLFLVFNVSGPIGLLVLIASLLPDGAIGGRLPLSPPQIGGLAGGLVVLSFIAWLIWYAFAGVHQARDLYHLATLEMAKRGIVATLGAAEQNPTETRP